MKKFVVALTFLGLSASSFIAAGWLNAFKIENYAQGCVATGGIFLLLAFFSGLFAGLGNLN